VPSASEISDSISPGSTEYGDRQVIEDNIQQVVQAEPVGHVAGSSSAGAQGKLSQGSFSDLPVTDGLSLGPGAGPPQNATIEGGANIDKFRLIAKNGRNPVIRKMARDAIRAHLNRSN